MTSYHDLHIPSVVVADSGGGGGGGAGATTAAAGDDDDGEEVTETKIIGVTETGVIRKRSFKRKLTKEEKSKRTYGADKSEYARIAERVMTERIFSSAIEGLRERWKMLTYMHTDCTDMVDQWLKKRQDMLHRRRRQDADIIIILVIALFVFAVVCWCISFLFSVAR